MRKAAQKSVGGAIAVGPPCEWTRDPVERWPDRLEDVPKCGQPSVALGRYSDWSGSHRVPVCETHNAIAGERATKFRGWDTVPVRPPR